MFYILFLLISNSKNQACAAVLRRYPICKTDIYCQFLARHFAQIAVLWVSWFGNLDYCHFEWQFLAFHYIYPLLSVWQYCPSAKIK